MLSIQRHNEWVGGSPAQRTVPVPIARSSFQRRQAQDRRLALEEMSGDDDESGDDDDIKPPLSRRQ